MFSAFLIVFVSSSGISGFAHANDGQAMSLPIDSRPLIVQTITGEREFSIEIADDGLERARGLMYRQDMPDDRGMLFVFDTAQPVGFWMKNTPMPLDLIFIREDGAVAGIKQGKPFSEQVISVPEPVRFVLELKAGIANETGMKIGDRFFHPSIQNAAGGNKEQ